MKTEPDKIIQALVIIAACLGLGWLAARYGARIQHDGDWLAAFWQQFQSMFFFAVLVERTVEVYLNATDQNGTDRYALLADTARQSGARPAAMASIVLGVLLALAGVRLMGTLGTQVGGGGLAHLLWNGSDVIVSAGLMAGGAALFHEVAEVLRGGVGVLGDSFKRAEPQAAAWIDPLPLAAVSRGKSIAQLDLAPHVAQAAQVLETAYPGYIVFTSGRRDSDNQARVMAPHIAKDRQWIAKTYADSPQKNALQAWVDSNPQATDAAAIAQGLAGIMRNWTEAQKQGFSRHMGGLAFDLQPVPAPLGEQIIATIRALPHFNKMLLKEGNDLVWHVAFDRV